MLDRVYILKGRPRDIGIIIRLQRDDKARQGLTRDLKDTRFGSALLYGHHHSARKVNGVPARGAGDLMRSLNDNAVTLFDALS